MTSFSVSNDRDVDAFRILHVMETISGVFKIDVIQLFPPSSCAWAEVVIAIPTSFSVALELNVEPLMANVAVPDYFENVLISGNPTITPLLSSVKITAPRAKIAKVLINSNSILNCINCTLVEARFNSIINISASQFASLTAVSATIIDFKGPSVLIQNPAFNLMNIQASESVIVNYLKTQNPTLYYGKLQFNLLGVNTGPGNFSQINVSQNAPLQYQVVTVNTMQASIERPGVEPSGNLMSVQFGLPSVQYSGTRVTLFVETNYP